MKQVTYICNCCEKKIVDNVIGRAKFTLGDRETGEKIETIEGLENVHWCKECAKMIAHWTSGIGKTALSQQMMKEKTKKKNVAADPKQLDAGKILALRRAGWTYKKIGEEIGYTAARCRQKKNEAFDHIHCMKAKGLTAEEISIDTELDIDICKWVLDELDKQEGADDADDA